MDITYSPMAKGFVYLSAVVDWASRRVLAWRLSNTMTADAPIETLQEAIVKYGAPEMEIMNTGQGSQFTSFERGVDVTGDHWPNDSTRGGVPPPCESRATAPSQETGGWRFLP